MVLSLKILSTLVRYRLCDVLRYIILLFFETSKKLSLIGETETNCGETMTYCTTNSTITSQTQTAISTGKESFGSNTTTTVMATESKRLVSLL